MTRPTTSLSLDLDNKWSYLKIHGDPWESLPSYLDVVVPRMLTTLEAHGLTITFFIVGQDAALTRNEDALGTIAAAGHEIGNHSFSHDPWLHQFGRDELHDELHRAETAITRATGATPTGFRGPGYSMSTATIDVLRDLGYDYDATTFPNVLNPLGRAYYLRTSDFTPEERAQRAALFGTWRDALRPNKPFAWDLGNDEALTEIPVTTMPLFKVPIHFSYVLYLAGISERLAAAYFRGALAMCRATKTAPSLLLHPLDFLGADDEPDLDFFPGMNQPGQAKVRTVNRLLATLVEHYEIVTMAEHAASLGDLPRHEPSFAYG